ncbi:hypothetical protein D3C78_1928610 [compost metagenome]
MFAQFFIVTRYQQEPSASQKKQAEGGQGRDDSLCPRQVEANQAETAAVGLLEDDPRHQEA